MARDIPALYDTIASQVVDRLVEFGEARMSPEFDSPLGLDARVHRRQPGTEHGAGLPCRLGAFTG
jgi:hypothetical protein